VNLKSEVAVEFVASLFRLREVPGSNFSPRIGYLDVFLCSFPQSLQADVEMLPKIKLHLFLLHCLIFLEGLRRITNNLNQDSRCPDRDSNLSPAEYK
jgi:hypothetical protein